MQRYLSNFSKMCDGALEDIKYDPRGIFLETFWILTGAIFNYLNVQFFECSILLMLNSLNVQLFELLILLSGDESVKFQQQLATFLQRFQIFLTRIGNSHTLYS